MAFQDLRGRIKNLAEQYRDLGCKHLARTIHVVLSPGLGEVQELCKQRFSVPYLEAEQVLPWVGPGPDDEFIITMRRCIAGTMALEASTAAAKAGYSILDNSNQIVVICDIRDEGAVERLRECIQTCRSAVRDSGLATNAFFFVGIFIHGVGSTAINGKEKVSLGQLSEEAFDRVFVLEHRNDSGVSIGHVEMLDLIAQLVAFLERRPTEGDHVEGDRHYSDWLLGNSTTAGRITGFSACSVVLPIEVLVENSVRGHAVLILREALFKSPDPKQVQHQVDSVLNGCHLRSVDDACEFLDSSLGGPIPGPMGNSIAEAGATNRFESEMFGSLRDGICRLCDQESLIDGYISDRFSAMQPVLDGMQEKYRQDLDEILAESFTSHRGCVSLAQEMADDLERRLGVTLADEFEEVESESPAAAIESLVVDWNAGPDGLSLLVRVFLVVGVLMAMAFGIVGASFKIKLILMMAAFLVGGATLVYWNIWRAGIKSQMARCWSLLFDEIKVQERNSALAALGGRRQFFLHSVRDLRQKLDSISSRLTWLLDSFNSHNLPQEDRWSNLWRRQETSVEDLLRMTEMVVYDSDILLAEVLSTDNPLAGWRDVFSEGSEAIREEEWRIVERVAIRLLAHADKIFAMSACNLIPPGSEKLDIFRNVLYETYRPFFKPQPGTSMGALRARFEIPGSGCVDGVAETPCLMAASFDDHYVVGSDPYRISLLTFLEDIHMEALGIRDEDGN